VVAKKSFKKKIAQKKWEQGKFNWMSCMWY